MSAPSKIEMGKKYRTSEGQEVALTTTSGKGDRPIIGQIKSSGGHWSVADWFEDGFYQATKAPYRLDLIEVREPREFKVWEKDGVIAVPTDMHHEKNLENAGCKLITLREVLPEGEQ